MSDIVRCSCVIILFFQVVFSEIYHFAVYSFHCMCLNTFCNSTSLLSMAMDFSELVS